MSRRTDLLGRVFGRLTIVALHASNPVRWSCRCSCGVERVVFATNLVNGYTRSCGCLRNEATNRRATTHGKSKTPTHRIWVGILTRVRGSSKSTRPFYLARGIDIDPRWHKYEAFLADMGERPSAEHSIDRKDNDRGYWPDNCRWATRKEQARNRRSNRVLDHDGVRASVAEWAERTGLTSECILSRINAGKSTAEALAPVDPSRRRAA